MTKRCVKCLVEKPETEFGRTAGGRLFNICATCGKKRAEARDATKEARNARVVARYGVLPSHLSLTECDRLRSKLAKYNLKYEDYVSMANRQSGHCAICDEGKELVIDHCHITGKVRGLLCNGCNKMLGAAKDNPDVLERASDYLKAGGYL